MNGADVRKAKELVEKVRKPLLTYENQIFWKRIPTYESDDNNYESEPELEKSNTSKLKMRKLRAKSRKNVKHKLKRTIRVLRNVRQTKQPCIKNHLDEQSK